jgi:hypothetical protein
LQKIAEIDSIVADGLLALLQSCRSSVFFWTEYSFLSIVGIVATCKIGRRIGSWTP